MRQQARTPTQYRNTHLYRLKPASITCSRRRGAENWSTRGDLGTQADVRLNPSGDLGMPADIRLKPRHQDACISHRIAGQCRDGYHARNGVHGTKHHSPHPQQSASPAMACATGFAPGASHEP
eukprot:366071-Chlamydomonas_euryale.AAC.7